MLALRVSSPSFVDGDVGRAMVPIVPCVAPPLPPLPAVNGKVPTSNPVHEEEFVDMNGVGHPDVVWAHGVKKRKSGEPGCWHVKALGSKTFPFNPEIELAQAVQAAGQKAVDQLAERRTRPPAPSWRRRTKPFVADGQAHMPLSAVPMAELGSMDDDELSAIDGARTIIARAIAEPAISPEDSVSRAGSPSHQAPAVGASGGRSISPGLTIVYREEATTKFPVRTRGQQLEAACGANAHLVDFAIERYGRTPGGMSTKQVTNWYMVDMEKRLPSHLQGRKFGQKKGDIQVCHIISKAKGGHDWVYNYFLELQEINAFFGKYLPLDWDRHIGTDAARNAETFARWVSKRARAVLCFGEFRGAMDYFLAR